VEENEVELIERLEVPVLKAELEKRGLPVEGNEVELKRDQSYIGCVLG
jgi:hypothetical protein